MRKRRRLFPLGAFSGALASTVFFTLPILLLALSADFQAAFYDAFWENNPNSDEVEFAKAIMIGTSLFMVALLFFVLFVAFCVLLFAVKAVGGSATPGRWRIVISCLIMHSVFGAAVGLTVTTKSDPRWIELAFALLAAFSGIFGGFGVVWAQRRVVQNEKDIADVFNP